MVWSCARVMWGLPPVEEEQLAVVLFFGRDVGLGEAGGVFVLHLVPQAAGEGVGADPEVGTRWRRASLLFRHGAGQEQSVDAAAAPAEDVGRVDVHGIDQGGVVVGHHLEVEGRRQREVWRGDSSVDLHGDRIRERGYVVRSDGHTDGDDHRQARLDGRDVPDYAGPGIAGCDQLQLYADEWDSDDHVAGRDCRAGGDAGDHDCRCDGRGEGVLHHRRKHADDLLDGIERADHDHQDSDAEVHCGSAGLFGFTGTDSDGHNKVSARRPSLQRGLLSAGCGGGAERTCGEAMLTARSRFFCTACSLTSAAATCGGQVMRTRLKGFGTRKRSQVFSSQARSGRT